MSYPSRLAALAHLNAEMAKVEAEVSRWERVVERLSAAGDPTRAARNCLRAAQDDLDRLDGTRDVLLEGDEGGRGEERSAPSPL